MDLFTLMLVSTRKNTNMASLKELQMLKPKNRKEMRKVKRKIRKILLYGKLLSLKNQNGNHLGGKVDLDGILSARQWPVPYLDRNLIFTLEGLI